MNRSVLWAAVVLFMVLGFLCPVEGYAGEKEIACSNGFLASLVQALIGDEIQSQVIIPPGRLWRAADSLDSDQKRLLEQSALMLYHPMQAELAKAVERLDTAHARQVAIRGSLNLAAPADYLRAGQEVQKALTDAYPEYSSFIQEQYDLLAESVKTTETELLGAVRKSKLIGLPCIAAEPEARYLKWLGLRVVATFNERDVMPAPALEALRQKAVSAEVWMVVGEKQHRDSGTAAAIAEAVSGQLVVLEGYPIRSLDGAPHHWATMIRNNTRALLQAVEWH